ncbi:receptor-like protein Cf-9 [Lycium ferocissimum]|uniref:receptor-like protein Cf-9 n=1 Tax=Lycium ferocissimum TaxID=112874 RepID=UPI002815EE9A|nr:receptor-like protein Cf-9 [Lycium ferocissimum]
MTGHVIELDLSCNLLIGSIDSNSSLFQLTYLQKLNFSRNNFSNSHISPKFSRFSSLMHLDLFQSYFSGQIPFELSHLSRLHFLCLDMATDSKLGLVAHDFKLLLHNLTQLRELDLSGVNISSTITPKTISHLTTLSLRLTGLYGIIPESIFHLHNLKKLYLLYNDQLSSCFPRIKWNSSASLIELHLTEVNLSNNFPESLGYLTSVNSLFLSDCNLCGPIPEYLSGNHFSGPLKDFKSNLLLTILLRENHQLQGHIPMSIHNLVNLEILDLSSSNFSGNVGVRIFSDLKHLWLLDISYNSIALINEKEVEFILPKSLEGLRLAACEVKELNFLRSKKQLSELDLSNNKLQGRIPDWAWSSWIFSVTTLNLSHNMLRSVDSIPLQY